MTEKLPDPVSDIVHGGWHALRAFLRLEELYRLSGPDERAAIRAGWPFGRRWIIPGLDYSDPDRITFSPLAGEDADGLDSGTRIEARLTYHAIENARTDFRDSGLDLTLCYHAGLAAGLDIVPLFEDAASVCDAAMAGKMLGFTRWKPEHKSLWRMGFRAVPFENGVAFEFIGDRDDYDALKPERLDEQGRVLTE